MAKSSAGRFAGGAEEAWNSVGRAGGDFMRTSFLLLAGSFVEEGAGAGARTGDSSGAPGVDVRGGEEDGSACAVGAAGTGSDPVRAEAGAEEELFLDASFEGVRVEDDFAFVGVRAEDDLALDEVRAGAPRDEVFRGGESERMLSERTSSSDDEETIGGGREVDAS